MGQTIQESVIALKYDFTAIETKWQTRWKDEKTFACVNGDTSKPKFYGLVEFPYPSAAGLHVGHPRPYTAMDVIARKQRMDGYNVLFPIGYDAFGLPTENYAIKNHIHPAVITKQTIENFTRQLHMLGYS
ncbi:MAG: class I tRNA ligase family protein, partial [Oscillospiraceae bacterium]|nr:class I tRNA ligase family protein [Oscillospiraceae bacterium]